MRLVLRICPNMMGHELNKYLNVLGSLYFHIFYYLSCFLIKCFLIIYTLILREKSFAGKTWPPMGPDAHQSCTTSL